MARKHLLVALGATLALTLLASPARGADNDLEDPNGCGGPFGTGHQGDVITLPPGVQPDIYTPVTYAVDAYGNPLNNTYQCVGGHWVLITSALEVGLSVAVDHASVTTAEGSSATMTGTYQYAGEEPLGVTASFGTATDNGDGTWSWSGTPDDGPATQPVTITAMAGTHQATTAFDLAVTNVAPTVTSLEPSTAIALTGQPVTFTGIATDPSGPDTTAGFTWSFDAPVVFDTCGSHTLDATATDKDSGVSESATSSPVQVVDAGFGAPLTPGAYNIVRAGQVVPVRVAVGCDGISTTGLSPAISLVRGDVDPETSSDDPSLLVPAANAPGETTGVMRDVGGSYLYNLRVPDAPSGSLFTIRVRPTAGAAPLSALLQLR